jgi:hypothetical protein
MSLAFISGCFQKESFGAPREGLAVDAVVVGAGDVVVRRWSRCRRAPSPRIWRPPKLKMLAMYKIIN